MPATPAENSKKTINSEPLKRFVTKVSRLSYGHRCAPVNALDTAGRAHAA
jgi:hypothetical protein